MLAAKDFRVALHPVLAWLLLLCLLRTLLPEAWLLTWHHHQHTRFEPAFAAKLRTAGKPPLLFTARHQHCHAEQFYNVPLAPGSIVELPRPRLRQLHAARVAAYQQGCPQLAAPRAQLRGPPAMG